MVKNGHTLTTALSTPYLTKNSMESAATANGMKNGEKISLKDFLS